MEQKAFLRSFVEGLGYRRVADMLIGQGVSTTKSSVERLIKGLPPYQGRRSTWTPQRF